MKYRKVAILSGSIMSIATFVITIFTMAIDQQDIPMLPSKIPCALPSPSLHFNLVINILAVTVNIFMIICHHLIGAVAMWLLCFWKRLWGSCAVEKTSKAAALYTDFYKMVVVYGVCSLTTAATAADSGIVNYLMKS